MYSICCACGVIFVIAVVPETKGRDLDSIAKLFVKNSPNMTKKSLADDAEYARKIYSNGRLNIDQSNSVLKEMQEADKNEITRL